MPNKMFTIISISLLIFLNFAHLSSFHVSYNINNKLHASTITKFNRLITSQFCEKTPSEDIDETVKKSGLEAGLWKSFTSEGSNVKPQELLKKYGIAYLATSISLAIVSYSICFLLVDNGVDVAGLLGKIGIQSSDVAANAGTAGIAYAIHKAASPIRFPPTVALTPLVASWIGKKPNEEAV